MAEPIRRDNKAKVLTVFDVPEGSRHPQATGNGRLAPMPSGVIKPIPTATKRKKTKPLPTTKTRTPIKMLLKNRGMNVNVAELRKDI